MGNIAKVIGIPDALNVNVNAIIDFLNSFSDIIDFTVVTAGTDVAVSHDLEHIPTSAIAVMKEGDTVSFANVYPGTTAWTKSVVYLSASLPGVYHVILRR